MAFGLLVARHAHAQNSSLFPSTEEEEAPQEPQTPVAQPATSPAPQERPPTPVEEPVSPPFGTRGQFVVTAASSADVQWTTFDGSQASIFYADFGPGLDYFVASHLSVGVGVGLVYSDVHSYGADSSLIEARTTSFAGGPRLGFDLPLGGAFSLYPRLTLGIEWAHRTLQLLSGSSLSVASPTGAPSTTQTGPYVQLSVPILWHLRPHLFLGFGPTLFRDFGRAQGGPDVGAERTIVSAGLLLGGYFGGAESPRPEPTPATASRRFGARGEIALTGELTASGSWWTYDGTGSSFTGVNLAPELDYFIVDHVSIGASAPFTYGRLVGLNGTTPVTFVKTTFGFSPRIGVDVPLGPVLSFYPRGGFGVGYATSDEQSGTSQNNPTETYVWMSLSTPLLVHMAPHLFAGFGPSLGHELSHTFSYPNGYEYQNRETWYGASLVVGGWL